MAWAPVLLLLLVVASGMILLGRLPRAIWGMTSAALLLGMAGYAWQGHPGLSGSPRDPAQASIRFNEDKAKLRNAFGGAYGTAAPWLTMSDGFARQGKTKEAANVLLSGLRAAPDDPNLWVGLGNALVEHNEGILSPAADYSYREAMRLAPDASAPAYFYGLALAEAGQYADARGIWGALDKRVPEKSPLHDMLTDNLALLDRIIAGQSGGAAR